MIELLILLAAGGAVAAGGFALWVHTSAARALGGPKLSVDAAAYGLGDVVRCRAASVTRAPVEVGRVTFTLECVETIRWTEKSGNKKQTRTQSETVWRGQHVVDMALRLAAGVPFDVAAELEVPERACPSFSAPNNRVEWRVRFDAVLPPRGSPVGDSLEVRVEARRATRRAGAA
jgi:hypothetical protein